MHPGNRKSQARFVCTACGHKELREAPTGLKPQGINAPTA
ncbi:hypothetical protein [Streptomyces sp. NPDC097610]